RHLGDAGQDHLGPVVTAVAADGHDDAAGPAVAPAVLLPERYHVVRPRRVDNDVGLDLAVGIERPGLGRRVVGGAVGERVAAEDRRRALAEQLAAFQPLEVPARVGPSSSRLHGSSPFPEMWNFGTTFDRRT